jgi:hypothetical protein
MDSPKGRWPTHISIDTGCIAMQVRTQAGECARKKGLSIRPVDARLVESSREISLNTFSRYRILSLLHLIGFDARRMKDFA